MQYKSFSLSRGTSFPDISAGWADGLTMFLK